MNRHTQFIPINASFEISLIIVESTLLQVLC